jgi:hypothetical protein
MAKSKLAQRTIETSAQTPCGPHLELEIAALMQELSDLHKKTSSLTKNLRLAGYRRSANTGAEAEVLLKNALRLLGDAMSYLPARSGTARLPQ